MWKYTAEMLQAASQFYLPWGFPTESRALIKLWGSFLWLEDQCLAWPEIEYDYTLPTGPSINFICIWLLAKEHCYWKQLIPCQGLYPVSFLWTLCIETLHTTKKRDMGSLLGSICSWRTTGFFSALFTVRALLPYWACRIWVLAIKNCFVQVLQQ